MPHVDIKYNPTKFDASELEQLLPETAELVGKRFDEDPSYVSVELVPQSGYSLNRKDLDLELNGSPNDYRVSVLADLTIQLRDMLVSHLDRLKKGGEVSAFCRLFEAGAYEYGVTDV